VAAGDPLPSEVAAAIINVPILPWTGTVWRCHARKYAGDNAGGSLRTTGRFNRGTDKFAPGETWPALYTGLALHVALGERLRHTTPASLSALGNQRLSRLRVTLQAVLNLCAKSGCAEPCISCLERDRLCRPADYEVTHQIALLARERAEALVIPSCTKFPEGNLIIFPDRLREGSLVSVEEYQDPELFVDWNQV
jgi:RES domain-containing protein